MLALRFRYKYIPAPLLLLYNLDDDHMKLWNVCTNVCLLVKYFKALHILFEFTFSIMQEYDIQIKIVSLCKQSIGWLVTQYNNFVLT